MAGDCPVIPCKRIEGELIFLKPCPYCRQKHRHGAGKPPYRPVPWNAGHRVAHCGDIKVGKGKNTKWIRPPGYERGYILEVVE
jgi:hypothetical protein